MSWLDLLGDDRPIRSIFGESVPDLLRVDLHEVVLHRDGPRITLRFDLRDYPDSPPKKWVAQRANTVQLELILLGIESLDIKNWSTSITADISLDLADDGSIDIAIASGSFQLQARSATIVISKISAYAKSA